MSVCESVSDVMPIFITRLSDDSGESITGGCATAGSVGAARDSRSCTICRAVMTSLDGIENQDDRRKTEDGLRSNRPQPRNAVERRLQRHGHQRFHVVGRQPRRFGLHLDERRGELREDVERRGSQGPGSRHHEQDCQRHDDDPVAEGERNEPAHQCPAPNSVPNSSAAPAVTTLWPAVRPLAITARSPEWRATCTRLGGRRRFLRDPRRPRRLRECR